MPILLRRAYPRDNCMMMHDAEYKSCLHRRPAIDEFNDKLMSFDGGNAVIQVGNVSLLRLGMYWLRRLFDMKHRYKMPLLLFIVFLRGRETKQAHDKFGLLDFFENVVSTL